MGRESNIDVMSEDVCDEIPPSSSTMAASNWHLDLVEGEY